MDGTVKHIIEWGSPDPERQMLHILSLEGVDSKSSDGSIYRGVILEDS